MRGGGSFRPQGSIREDFLPWFFGSRSVSERCSRPEPGDSRTRASSAQDVQPRPDGATAGLRARVWSCDQALVTSTALLGGPACSPGASCPHTCIANRV